MPDLKQDRVLGLRAEHRRAGAAAVTLNAAHPAQRALAAPLVPGPLRRTFHAAKIADEGFVHVDSARLQVTQQAPQQATNE